MMAEPMSNREINLRTYRKMKREYCMGKYLHIVINKNIRSSFATFRLSDHSLMIEKGRHIRLDYEKRLCPFKCAVVEDEHHFLFICP
jgi:hypothetical protein